MPNSLISSFNYGSRYENNKDKDSGDPIVRNSLGKVNLFDFLESVSLQ